MKVPGKVAIVDGGSQGMEKASASIYSRANAKAVIGGVNNGKGRDETVAELSTDISKPGEV